MPLSADDLKAQILIEIGDTGVVEENLDKLWLKHDDRPLWLQYLWAKQDAIRSLQGSIWADYSMTTEAGAQLKLKERFDNLTAMLADVKDEIKNYRSSRSPVVGQLSATAPVESPVGRPDANSGRYRGDPNDMPPSFWPR